MLNTSFTLRPSTSEAGGGSYSLENQKPCGRVEVTFREARKRIIVDAARRLRGGTSLYSSSTRDDDYYNPCRRRYYYPSYHYQHESAFKRQRLISFQGSSYHRHQRQLPPPFHTLNESSVVPMVELPQICRIPMDFDPPSDEEYWKRRCFLMQSICQDTRCRLREMEEDQRQLRRRIHELETQLLLQSSAATAATQTTLSPVASENTHIVESRDCDEEDPGKLEHCLEESRDLDNQKRYHARKRVSIDVPKTTDHNHRIKPPTLLSIPKDQPAASCLYLTDGEGLSDSEFMHDDDECEEEELEDREGAGNSQRV
ncbi:hypothetical protein IV203_010167 [Nitzschia inconspicua]|uniref:Uncharacterized protein n=1 Tax=Nitzschia inconspicua TaxID=303405 RepID=A0A9K3KVU1_9STRA|nr:hypothetical protein IV203_010167 [Nitzschia inconspicua]